MDQQTKNKIKKIPGTLRLYNFVNHVIRALIFYLKGRGKFSFRYYDNAFSEALGDPKRRSDISDHLGILFFTAVNSNSKLMVELGTRGGESTRALLAAASLTDSVLLSIDIEDCSQIKVPFSDRWHFLMADDIKFGKTGFREWCIEHSLPPVIDLLFIDTSHEYTHTKNEIELWAGYLSDRGILIFHDTNMGEGVFRRFDGSLGFGWNNQRGVIRAVEEFLNRKYDENAFFCDVTDKFNLIHFPNSSGFTILQRRLVGKQMAVFK